MEASQPQNPLVAAWQQADRSTGRIVITDEAAARDGIDVSTEALMSSLNDLRPDLHVGPIYRDVEGKKTHIVLAWRAAVLLLVLSLPAVVTAAPPPVSQIGTDSGPGFRLINPVEIPREDPPPRPQPQKTPAPELPANDTPAPASPGPTIPSDVIHRTLMDVLQLPEVADSVAGPAQHQPRRLGVFTAPGCGPCGAQKTEWGDQPKRDGVEVTYYVRNDWTLPDWVPADRRSFPCTFTLDTVGSDGKPVYAYIHGRQSWQRMQEFLAEHPAPGQKLAGTVTLGAVKGKAQVAQALKLLNEMGPGQFSLSWQVSHAPQIGQNGDGLRVDRAGTATYSWDADSMRLKLNPPLRLTAATWLGRYNQPVAGVFIERNRFTIEMPGMIDVARRLVE